MITPVHLPQLELTMENVTVVRILVREGDIVVADQGLIEVETQKAVSEVPAPVGGVVRDLRVKEGEVIGERALLCYLTASVEEALPSESEVRESRGPVRATPAARKVARDLKIDISLVTPSSASGRVGVEDVEAYVAMLAVGPASPAQGDGWSDIPQSRVALNSQMQRALAEIPQITISRQFNVSAICQRMEGTTFTHRLLSRLAGALRRHPRLRTTTDGRRERTLPVAVALAIGTPAGLVAPVLSAQDLVSIEAIAARVADYRERAERRSLRPDEFRGGAFALTNLGMFGVDFFSPFVFHGQTAVLAVGKISDGQSGRMLAWFSLAADHRVVDGAEAARFLATLQAEIES